MPLTTFSHVNIRTRNLQTMVDWYADILGLVSGKRPPFPFGGAWLYLGDQPYIHLVEVPDQRDSVPDNTLEHFAFDATGMQDMLAKLDARGIAHTVDPVPGFPIVQINFRDPDGNHIHLDYHPDEHSA